MAVIGLINTSDNLCLAKFLDVRISSKRAVMKVVYIKSVFSANIKQAYEEFVHNVVTYNKRVKNNMFLIKIDQSDIQPVPGDFVTIVKFQRSNLTHHCYNNIAMTKLQFCETITFHEDEFKIHDNGKVSVENITFRLGEFVLRQTPNGTIRYVQICLNDYYSKHMMLYRKYRAISTGTHIGGSRTGILFLLCAVIALSQQS